MPSHLLTPKVALLLVALLLVLGPWLVWRIGAVRRVAPLAVVQILAGVALGPTLLGRLAPEWHAALFSPWVLNALNGLSNLGVALYVFCSGLHLDTGGLRENARRLGPMAAGSMGLPLLLGLGAGFWIAAAWPGAVGPRADVVGFAISVAICVAVTALPVLAAILREMGLIAGRLGQTALALAALNDVALWMAIAALLALTRGSAAASAGVALLALGWMAGMALVVRPLLARLAARGPAEDTMLVVALAIAFASAMVAEAIDLGLIIGAFAAGAAMPAAWRAPLLAKIEPLTAAVLLPFFFVSTGLRALIEPGSAAFLGMLVLVTAATVLGKVAGTALLARAAGERWRDALALGALMQTKGLMEVVVLAVLLEAGLIAPPIFSALVAMAVVCTIATTPLARLALAPARARRFPA
ncbi:MAG: cation:proton antiporter [Roseomonas sp.]|nr:cation:proton antiporter [Roseomonas sp.]